MIPTLNMSGLIPALSEPTSIPVTKKALLANRYVLLEKPMAITSEECRELITLAESSQLTLMVDHTFVYHGAVKWIKQEIESGAMGDVAL